MRQNSLAVVSIENIAKGLCSFSYVELEIHCGQLPFPKPSRYNYLYCFCPRAP